MAVNGIGNGENGALNQDWVTWRRLVLSELERLNKTDLDQQKAINENKVDIALLKLKSGIWGAAAGALTIVLMLIAKALIK